MVAESGSHTSYRKSRRDLFHFRGIYGIAGIMVVVLVLGIALGTRLGSDDAKAADAAEDNRPRSGQIALAEDESVGPYRFEGEAPLGYAHNQNGAMAAASGFVTLPVRLLTRSQDDAINALGKMVAPEAISTIVDKYQNDYATVRAGFATAQTLTANPRVFAQAIPAGVRVVDASKDKVRTQVWLLVMVAIEGLVQPTAGWELHDITVVWRNGDWKVSEWTGQPGPTPSWGSSTATGVQPFLDSVTPFQPLRYRVS